MQHRRCAPRTTLHPKNPALSPPQKVANKDKDTNDRFRVAQAVQTNPSDRHGQKEKTWLALERFSGLAGKMGQWLIMCWITAAGLWAQEPPPPPAGIDPAPLTHLLATYSRPDGLMDYAAWRASGRDLAALDAFIARFETPPPPQAVAEGREAVAGWINLHNALALREILRHPHWTSVRADRGFFTELRHSLAGQPVSLEMLAERGVVPRLGWRARSVLLLPARGGPPAPREALREEEISLQVDRAWRHWLAQAGAFEWGPDRIRLPQPFFWHRHEWDAEGGWRTALAPLAPPHIREHLARLDIPVEFLPFDWTLNDPIHPPGSYRGWRLLRDRIGW